MNLGQFKCWLLICSLFVSATAWSQVKKISGKIISEEDAKPLIGVSITIKGKAGGTQTNTDGIFSIDAAEGDVLEISSTGFEWAEIPVSSSSNYDLALKPDATKLGEVVVVGYGTQSRRNVTSAISKLDREVLANQPRANVGSALQGTVSGLHAHHI